MSTYEEFLDGEHPEHVAVYLTEGMVGDLGPLEQYGERTDDGIVLVVPGDQGRSVFKQVTGMEAMQFSQQAMGTNGDIADSLAGGDCPSKHPDEPASDHETEFVFAFFEEQNEEVGGLYAEGDVMHAYAYCECGTAYSDRWVV
ncbi:DUF5807 family protein [Salarchaeum japonicum]|uniref:DUF5807 family protein n=1 Tax=Salarchaeum japonicum TaxID=555573 RepID=A0AAV3T1I4_9EURY|nr:DUF5807 family protein [Salarchaeum japonicum]